MTISDQTQTTETSTSVIDKVKHLVGVDTPAAEPLTQPITIFKSVHIIVNPASGQTGINLPALNKVLHDLDIDWEMFVIRNGTEAAERAKQAVAAGVDAIVVYGGDGTVLEVASAIAGSNVPIVILPGGTANVLSVELGIPADQTQAALLLGGAPNEVRGLDMGALMGTNLPGNSNGDLLFFHMGMGLEGTMHEQADRDAKDRSGIFAYVTAALKSLTNPVLARYHLILDGQPVEAEGINCMVTNFGSVGVPGISLSNAIDIGDGLLDVIIFQDANVSSLVAAAASVVTSGELAQAPSLLQWQAREVTIVADPPQTIVVDGELVEIDTITIRTVPGAVRVVVPAASSS